MTEKQKPSVGLIFTVLLLIAFPFGFSSCFFEPVNTTDQLVVSNLNPEIGRIFLNGEELSCDLFAKAYFAPVKVRLLAELRSPDIKGRFICWQSEDYGNLYENPIHLVTGDTYTLIEAVFGWVQNVWPAWIDDRTLAFVSDREGSQSLYVVGADGLGLRKVPSQPAGIRELILNGVPAGSTFVVAKIRDFSGTEYECLVDTMDGVWIDIREELEISRSDWLKEMNARATADGSVLVVIDETEYQGGGSFILAAFDGSGALSWRLGLRAARYEGLSLLPSPEASAILVLHTKRTLPGQSLSEYPVYALDFVRMSDGRSFSVDTGDKLFRQLEIEWSTPTVAAAQDTDGFWWLVSAADRTLQETASRPPSAQDPVYGDPAFPFVFNFALGAPTHSPDGLRHVESRVEEHIAELYVVDGTGGQGTNVTYYQVATP